MFLGLGVLLGVFRVFGGYTWECGFWVILVFLGAFSGLKVFCWGFLGDFGGFRVLS